MRSSKGVAHSSNWSSWRRVARTFSLASSSSPSSMATAVCDPLWGSTPIITFTASSSIASDGATVGTPDFGSSCSRTSFEPHLGEIPASQQLVRKPDGQSRRQAHREPAHRDLRRYGSPAASWWTLNQARMGAPIGRLAGCAPVCALGGSLDMAVEDAESDVTREIEREKERGAERPGDLVSSRSDDDRTVAVGLKSV